MVFIRKIGVIFLRRWWDIRLLLLKRSSKSWHKVVGKYEMVIDPNDYVDRAYFLGNHDPGLRYAIKKWVRVGETCIDIGAQKGYFTLLFAQIVGKNGRVLAFEPDPRSRQALAINCKRNKLCNVEILEYGLGERDYFCQFHLSSQLGWSSQFPNREADKTIVSTIEVPIRSFDHLVSSSKIVLDITQVSFIKIDCEGSEPFVLAGMTQVLSKTKPFIWIEVNMDSLRVAGSNPNIFQDRLKELGYSIFLPRYYYDRFGRPSLSLKLLNDGLPSNFLYDLVALKVEENLSRLKSANIEVICN